MQVHIVKLLSNKQNIILLLILALSIFLRFYQIADTFVFTADEEYAVTLALPLVQDFHVIWIGENAADTGFYMGPFWVYFTAFWLSLFKSNVLVLAYVVAAIGSLTTLAIFLVAKSLFNFKVAAISSLLYATLPLKVYFDKKFWLLNPAPLLIVLLLYTLFMTRNNSKWWIVVAFLYGLVFHIHLSLAPLGIVILYYFLEQRKSLNKEIIILSFLSAAIALSPLIAFDYFHKGSNITAPFNMSQQMTKQTRQWDPTTNLTLLFQSMGRLWYLSPNRTNADEVLHACNFNYLNKKGLIAGVNTSVSSPIRILSIFSFLLIGWFFLSKNTFKDNNTRLLALFLVASLLSFILFPGVALEYYLLGTSTVFLFVVGILTNSKNRYISSLLILGLLILSTLGIYTITTVTPEYGVASKIELIKKVSEKIGNHKFELIETGLCHGNEGWRILFRQYGKMPAKSSTDKSLGYLYTDEISSGPVDYKVIMAESRVKPNFNTNNATIISEGGFTAYIFKLR